MASPKNGLAALRADRRVTPVFTTVASGRRARRWSKDPNASAEGHIHTAAVRRGDVFG